MDFTKREVERKSRSSSILEATLHSSKERNSVVLDTPRGRGTPGRGVEVEAAMVSEETRSGICNENETPTRSVQ